ncbi:MAG: MaoC family dehydratase [Chloroflexi bacterium]|nr:MaoC family dehydratase [Chloroflexota bacterium]
MTQVFKPKEVTYEEVEEGAALGPIEEVVTAEDVKQFMDSIGSKRDWYSKGSPFGQAVVPPMVLEQMANGLRGTRYVIKATGGGLHAGIETEYLKPVPVGTKVRIEGKLASKYIRREKYYFITEATIYNQQGEVAMRYRTIQANLPDPKQARVR